MIMEPVDNMTAVAFDTLKLARALRDRGRLTPEQAEGVADSLSEAFRDEMATKSDIQRLEGKIERQEENTKAQIERLEQKIDRAEERMTAQFKSLEERTSARFMSLEQRMTIKLGGMMVVAVGTVAVLVKLL